MIASAELTVDGMHCNSCGLLIDDAVEELAGVQRCATDVRRRRTIISLDPAVVTLDAILTAITDLGYRATPVAR